MSRRLAVLGAALLVAGLLHPIPSFRPAALHITPPTAGVLPSVPMSDPVALPPSTRVGEATAPVSIRYTFDGGIRKPITDLSGGHELRPLAENGGALRLVPQGPGLAVDYPDRCTLAREVDCPRAILEGLRDDNLNPGTRSLQYGASVLMTHGDLSDGANVVQKGY